MSEPLAWEIDVRLVRSREVMSGRARAFGLAAAIGIALVSLMMLATGSPEGIPVVAAGVAVLAVGLWILGVLVSLVVFRGRMRMRYELDRDGLTAQVIDRRVRATSRAATVVGLLAGSGVTAGAGVIAATQAATRLEWRGSFRAVASRSRGTIDFRNAWHSLLVVHVTEDRFEHVQALVAECMGAAGTATRIAGRRSPVPARLGLTALAVAASMALVPLVGAFGVPALLVLVILAFSVASLWLVSVFGWVVLACLVAVGALSVADDGIVSGDDITAAVVAGAGAVVLAWLSLLAVRGRLPSILERDMKDQSPDP